MVHLHHAARRGGAYIPHTHRPPRPAARARTARARRRAARLTHPRAARRAAAARLLRAALCLAAACAGDSRPVAPSGTLAVDAPGAALSVAPGQTGSGRVAVVRGGGFVGEVALAAAEVPPGLAATLTPGTLGADASESVVTAAAAADVAPGSYAFTVVATGAGVARATATVRVDVARPPAPAIAIGTTADALTVAAGGSAATGVTVTRANGFRGEVALVAEGVPAGVAATFAPATLAADAAAATLLVAAGAGAPAGAHRVTLRARGAGVADAAATLPLTVTPPAAGEGPTPYVASGRLTDARGAPLAGVTVVLDNQLLHGSYVTATTGGDGRYRADLPPVAVTWAASARMTRVFEGARYELPLAPVDPSAFAGNAGGVRDFVWRVRGAAPDGGWYGSPVVVYTSLDDLDLDARSVEVTLTPVGPLIDGSAGEPIVARPAATGDGMAVEDVPIGRYTITAREVAGGGAPRPLRLRVRNRGEYAGALVAGFAAPYGPTLGLYRIDLEVRR